MRFMGPGEHAVGDPVGDGTGLAGSGAREHHDRTLQGLGDGSLLVVEAGEHLLGIHGGDGATGLRRRYRRSVQDRVLHDDDAKAECSVYESVANLSPLPQAGRSRSENAPEDQTQCVQVSRNVYHCADVAA